MHTPLARAASRSPPAANSALSTGDEKRQQARIRGRARFRVLSTKKYKMAGCRVLDARFLPESNRHWHDDCLRTVYTRTTSSLPASSNKSCAIHAMEPGKQSLKSSEPLHTATHWWSMMPGCSLSAAFSSARDRSLTLNDENEARVRVRARASARARARVSEQGQGQEQGQVQGQGLVHASPCNQASGPAPRSAPAWPCSRTATRGLA